MSEHFNQLTPAESERLALLIEECSEVQKTATKILRHGYENGWNGSNNRKDLTTELGHLRYAVELLTSSGDIGDRGIAMSRDIKEQKIKPFLHHQFEDAKP